MSKRTAKQAKRRRPVVIRVPGWYYAALAVIFLIGSMLIVYSLRNPTINAKGMTSEGDFPKGAENAPVTIIDWGSFTCSHCRDYVLETMPLIEKEYIETGKVRYIHRPRLFDLDTNRNARLAAESLYCAGEQGKFWEVHDWLFINLEAWIDTDVVVYLVDTVAPELGLDSIRLERCLTQERYLSRLQSFQQDAADRDINSTPTFAINDRLLVGAQPYEEFRAAIEEALQP